MKTALRVGIVAFMVFLIGNFTGCLDDGDNNGDGNSIPGLTSVGQLLAQPDDWTNDNTDDGLRIGFYFLDADGTPISFDDVGVDVKVVLFTQVQNTSGVWQKDRLVYQHTFTISSSQNVKPTGTGIQVPWEDIEVNPNEDDSLGVIEVTVSVPGHDEYPPLTDDFVRLYLESGTV